MRKFVTSALLTLTLLLCAWQLLLASQERGGTESGGEHVGSETPAAGQSPQAPQLFKEKCARCHGEDGRGQTVIGGMLGAPNFKDESWWAEEKNEKRFVRSITEGKKEMPAFGKKLSKREISALAAYVRGFRKSDR